MIEFFLYLLWAASILSEFSFDEIILFSKSLSLYINANPLEIFETAVKNVTPIIEVKAKRFGGATYQVPMEVNNFRGANLAIKWILSGAKKRPGKTMAIKLANELIDASNNLGEANKKKQETHRMAEANKAFAHFRY